VIVEKAGDRENADLAPDALGGDALRDRTVARSPGDAGLRYSQIANAFPPP
jgi:hypothetical protein